MKLKLKPFATGCLTGHGVILDIRDEYVDSFIAFMDELGSIDAPERIAAGSVISHSDKYCPVRQSQVWRP